jgi:uncharacterized protein YcbK (DUF882 family)
MKITKHFSIHEFSCNDKNRTPYPRRWVKTRLTPLCLALEIIRKEFDGKPITITSGYRTPEYNKSVGGVKFSQHKDGRAVDVRVKGVAPRKVAHVIRQLIRDGIIPKGGVGDYSSFTHYDTRGTNARWKGR